MTSGYIVQVVGDAIEVLCEKTFERTWRKLEHSNEVKEGDTIWWQSYRAYLTRPGEFKDKCIGRCERCNPHGRPSSTHA